MHSMSDSYDMAGQSIFDRKSSDKVHHVSINHTTIADSQLCIQTQ